MQIQKLRFRGRKGWVPLQLEDALSDAWDPLDRAWIVEMLASGENEVRSGATIFKVTT